MLLARVAPIAVAMTIVGGAAAGTVVAAPWRSHEQWDPRVAPLVSFVERTRGLHFKHPVPVRFLDTKHWRELMAGATVSLAVPPAEPDPRLDLDAINRAEGLTDVSVATTTFRQDIGQNSLGVYVNEDKYVAVNADRLGPAGPDQLSFDMRAVLVHELTHALDDQYFPLHSIRAPQGELMAREALVEGDASRVADVYRARHRSNSSVVTSDSAAARLSTEELRARRLLDELSEAPYQLGAIFLDELVARRGLHAIDDAFAHPPQTEADILDPSRYLRHDQPATVRDRGVPKGARNVFPLGDFGAFSTFLMLSTRVSYEDARTAVTGWEGSLRVAYQLDHRQCAAITTRLGRVADADRFFDAAAEWIDKGPAGAASVSRHANDVALRVCDPGPSYRQPVLHGISPFQILRDERVLQLNRRDTEAQIECYVHGEETDPSILQITYPYTTDSPAVSAAATQARFGIRDKCLS